MKTQTLQTKLERYLNGQSMPAETRQIQTWLSCTATEINLGIEEKMELEASILKEIQEDTGYPVIYPRKEKPWWQKVVASFF